MAHPDCPFRAEGRRGGVASPTERDPAWRGMDHLDASTAAPRPLVAMNPWR